MVTATKLCDALLFRRTSSMWSLAYAVIQKELELFVENAQEDGPHVHGPPEIKVHVVI